MRLKQRLRTLRSKAQAVACIYRGDPVAFNLHIEDGSLCMAKGLIAESTFINTGSPVIVDWLCDDPGDRVRVTAGDLCGETGTVVGGVPHGLVEVEWDRGGEFHIDPERLEDASKPKWRIFSNDQRDFDGTFTWWVWNPSDPGSIVSVADWNRAIAYVQENQWLSA